MAFRDFSVKTKLTLLLGVTIAALLGVELFNWHALTKASDRLAEACHQANVVEEAVDTARLAQVHFKSHVQEWKNLLIRGGEAKEFEAHTKVFETSGQAVVADLRKLEPMMKEVGLKPDAAQKAIAEHEALNKRYLEALARYNPADRSGPRRSITWSAASIARRPSTSTTWSKSCASAATPSRWGSRRKRRRNARS
jgi:methyl-accepting chemotaxis protein-1 (serine sensor receptor)